MPGIKEIITNTSLAIASKFGKSVEIGEDNYFGIEERYNTNSAATGLLNTYKSTVYDCVDLIGDAFSGYEIEISKVDTKGQKDNVPQHDLITLFNDPQPEDPAGMTKEELLKGTAVLYCLTGEAFWYVSRGSRTGRPMGIYLVRPDRVGIHTDKKGAVTGYYIRRNGKQPIELSVEELWHFKGFNPHKMKRGYGPIQANLSTIRADEYSARFTSNFFKNNAGISGIITIKGTVAKEAFKKFVRGWRQKYEGVDNAGKTALLRDSEAIFTKVGLGLDEIDMSAIRKMTTDEILMALRVPRPLLGQAEDAGLGRGNVEALEYIFAKYNINPKMKMVDGILQKMLKTFYPQDKMIVGHKNIIPEDKEFEQKQEMEDVNTVRTVNEIREKRGLPPVKGGDNVYVPINMIPVSEANTPAEPTKSKTFIVRRTIVKDDEPTEPENPYEINKENFRLSLMRNQKKYEKKFDKKATEVLAAQEVRVQKAAKTHIGKGVEKNWVNDLFGKESIDLWIKAVDPIMGDLLGTQGSIALRFAGEEDDEFKVTQALTKATKASIKKMAKRFDEHTAEKLNKTISEGLELGEGVAEISKRISETYEQAKGSRAEMISRTETLKASNDATEVAYAQTGYITEKQWYANPGACEECEAIDGKSIALGESFYKQGEDPQADYEDIEYPPLHPQCRCTIIPVR